MLSPGDLNNISNQSELSAASLEDAIWLYIIDTLLNAESSRNQDNDVNADDWKQELMTHVDDIVSYAQKHGKKTFSNAITQVTEAIAATSLSQQEKNEKRLQELASIGLTKQPSTLEESKEVNRIIEVGKADATHYLALAQKNMPKHAANTFKQIVSDASLAIKNGEDPRGALTHASERWAKVGIPALVDKAGRRWHPETYMRMVIQTQVQSVTNEVTIQRSKDYTGLVKVSSHVGCRPTHLQYQGRIYSVSNTNTTEYPDLYEATNFGSAGGLCGINCHHYVMTYVPGYDVPDLDTLDPQSNNERYQLTQTQRRLEREVRAAKREQLAADKLGDEKSSAIARRKVLLKQKKVRQFIDKHSDVLVRDYSRERIFTNTSSTSKEFKVISALRNKHTAFLKGKSGDTPTFAEFLKAYQLGYNPNELVNHAVEIPAKIGRYERTELNAEAYNKHVKGTKAFDNYQKGRKTPISQLIVSPSEARDIVAKAAASVDTDNVRTVNVQCKKIVGYFVSINGERIPTKRLRVSFSKHGAHLTPLSPFRKGE